MSRIVSDIPNSKRVIFTAAGTQDVKVDIADDNQITNQTTVITGTSTPYAYITLTDINGTILKNINATLSGNDYITAGRYVTQADGSGSWKIELNQSLDSGSVFVAEAAYGWKTAKDVAYVYNTQVSKNIEEIKQVQQNAQDLYDNGKGGLSYKTEFNKGKLQTINQAVTDALTAQSGYSMAAENAVRHARQYLEKLADANAAREIGAVEEAKALMQEAAEYLKNTNQELQVALNKSEEIIQKSAVAWTAYKEMKPDQLSVDVKAADEAVKKAEEAGKEAQAAHNAAQQVLNEAKKDGLITPTEQAAIQQANKAVDDANAKVESTKKAAQDLVSALPESVKDDKDKLQKRLDAVQPATKVEVPEVTEYREVPDYGIIYTDQMGYNTIYSRNRKRLTRLVEQELPETGSKESANLTAIGLLMASLGLSSFVAGHRKKREK
ncbi:TPA: LPXTG cell wall anchor domain-containing protein [Streptococcus equi subsp. zooepidemicus]|nr:LPXTG cell wall anchor domain-containing protein [Streptococcus equi subsp. zooepidemicus]